MKIIEDQVRKFFNASGKSIDQDTSFMELGMDSITAIQLKNEIQDALGGIYQLDNTLLIEHSTLNDLIEYMRHNLFSESISTDKQLKNEIDISEPSVSQIHLYMYAKAKTNIPLNISAIIQLRDDETEDTIRSKLNSVFQKHKILCSEFVELSQDSITLKFSDIPNFEWNVYDWSELDLDNGMTRLKNKSTSINDQPIAVDKTPLIKATLFKLCNKDIYLLITIHHILVDANSINVILKEVLGQSKTENPEYLFSDHVAWENRCVNSKNTDKLISYWSNMLKGSKPLHWFGERKNATDLVRTNNSIYEFKPEENNLIEDFIKNLKVTRHVFFQGILNMYNLIIHKQNDTTIIVPYASQGDSKYENSVGYFATPLPIRQVIDLQWNMKELFENLRSVILNSIKHHAPIGFIMDTQSHDKNHIISSKVMLQCISESLSSKTGIDYIKGVLDMDLHITIQPTSHASMIAIAFNAFSFSETEIDHLLKQYATLALTVASSDVDTKIKALNKGVELNKSRI